MGRVTWKPANLLYPIPAVLVTSVDENGRPNVMTAAWAGTICSDPVMVSVSIRKSRYSHGLISKSREFGLCLTTKKLAKAADFCGVKSGRDVDKFAAMHLTPLPSSIIKTPGIAESPVCLECEVVDIQELGSHDMFIAKVVATDVDDRYLDDKGRLDLDRADLIAYSHGGYFTLGRCLGRFGDSVRKKPRKAQPSKKLQKQPRKKHIQSKKSPHKRRRRQKFYPH
jgi:flavin reductase (DIM6/NTAB) family NADH-FMN oxidoreductase RutF